MGDMKRRNWENREEKFSEMVIRHWNFQKRNHTLVIVTPKGKARIPRGHIASYEKKTNAFYRAIPRRGLQNQIQPGMTNGCKIQKTSQRTCKTEISLWNRLSGFCYKNLSRGSQRVCTLLAFLPGSYVTPTQQAKYPGTFFPFFS